MDDTIDCPVCGGPATPLGVLGNRAHFRCRDCGMTFNVEVDEVDLDDDVEDEE